MPARPDGSPSVHMQNWSQFLTMCWLLFSPYPPFNVLLTCLGAESQFQPQRCLPQACMFSVTVLVQNKLNTSPRKHKHVSSHQCYFIETAVKIHPRITQLSVNMKDAPSMYLPQHKDSAVSTSRECDEVKFRSE